jgi:hypothetical protein
MAQSLYWLGRRLDTWRVFFRFRSRYGRFFSFPKSRDRLWGPLSFVFSAQWGWRSKRGQGRKLYQSPPYTAALNRKWNYTPTPHYAFLSSTRTVCLSCGIMHVRYVTRRWKTLKPEVFSVLRYTAGKLTKLVQYTFADTRKYSYAKILGAHSGVYRDLSLLWCCSVSTGK